jgi:glycosyltransferase involved in cell wall biosynthesis
MPVYNEAATLARQLSRVREAPIAPYRREIIAVDDGSTDGSREILAREAAAHADIRALYHGINRGKGAALATALRAARGSVIIFQDADLEQDPQDYRLLLSALERSPAVFSTRNRDSSRHPLYPHYALGSRLTTALVNVLYDARLSDINSGYKALRRATLEGITLRAERFNICEELTVKLLKRGVPIAEVPISYAPRTFAEGKKIRAIDGLRGLWTVIKYRFVP